MFVTLTPNPAIDRIVTLDRALQPQHLHRAATVHEQAGGKGVNVSRMLRTLGAAVSNAAVLGGFNGQKFAWLLEREKLPARVEFAGEGETRECQILLNPALNDSASHPTEVNEAGLSYDAEAFTRLLDGLPKGQVVISGSLPPKMQLEAFSELLRRSQPLAVDTSGPALQVALEQGAGLIKPNLDELQMLTGQADLETAQRLHERYGTRLLVTRGREGAWLIGPECWEAQAPDITAVNPVGAGDSTLAGFLWAQGEGLSPQEALRWAVAAGSASAQKGGPQRVERPDVEALYRQIQVQQIR